MNTERLDLAQRYPCTVAKPKDISLTATQFRKKNMIPTVILGKGGPCMRVWGARIQLGCRSVHQTRISVGFNLGGPLITPHFINLSSLDFRIARPTDRSEQQMEREHVQMINSDTSLLHSLDSAAHYGLASTLCWVLVSCFEAVSGNTVLGYYLLCKQNHIEFLKSQREQKIIPGRDRDLFLTATPPSACGH